MQYLCINVHTLYIHVYMYKYTYIYTLTLRRLTSQRTTKTRMSTTHIGRITAGRNKSTTGKHLFEIQHSKVHSPHTNKVYPSTSSGHLFEIQTDDREQWQSASEEDPRSLVRPRSHGCGSDELTTQKCPTGHNSSPCLFPGQKYPALHATQLVMAPLSSVPGPHRAGIQSSHFSLLFRTHSHATMRPTRAKSSCSSSKPTSAHEPLKPCEPMPGMPEGALFHVAPALSSSLRAGQKFSKSATQ